MGYSEQNYTYMGDGPEAQERQAFLDRTEKSFEGAGHNSNLLVVDAQKYVTPDNKVDLHAMLEDAPEGQREGIENLIKKEGQYFEPGEGAAVSVPAAEGSDHALILMNIPGESKVELTEQYDPFFDALREIEGQMPNLDVEAFGAKFEFYHEVGHHLERLTGITNETGATVFAALVLKQEGEYEQAPGLSDAKELMNAVHMNRAFDAVLKAPDSVASEYLSGHGAMLNIMKDGIDVGDATPLDLIEKAGEIRGDVNAHMTEFQLNQFGEYFELLEITDFDDRARFVQAVLDPDNHGANVDGMVTPRGDNVRDLLPALSEGLTPQAKEMLENYVEASKTVFGADLKADVSNDHEQAQVMDSARAEVAVQQQFEGAAPTEVSGDPSILQQVASYVPGLQSFIPVPDSAPTPVQNGPDVAGPFDGGPSMSHGS